MYETDYIIIRILNIKKGSANVNLEQYKAESGKIRYRVEITDRLRGDVTI